MADSVNYSRLLNPWVLHLQKMSLELKCPSCLNLLNKPLLLPCNHIFCSSCVPISSKDKLNCPICRSPYNEQDLRPTPHMENIVSIYTSMEMTFGLKLFASGSESDSRDLGKPMSRSPLSGNTSGSYKVPNACVEAVQYKRDSDSPHPSHTGEAFNCQQTPCKERHSTSDDQNKGVDMNQVTQPSPDSPPSFGETKDSDYESSDQGAKRKAKGLPTNAVENDSEGGNSKNWYSGSAPQEVDCTKEPKKQKLNMAGNSVNLQPTFSDYGDVLMPKSEGGGTTKLPCAQPASTSDCAYANPSFICGFCQTYKLSELSGPMLHYFNGEEVAIDKLPLTNVVHVHRKCILWAPKVYYVGEKVVGLDEEISRGAKLKCSSCGIKGATLGCYVKSCRKNYHAPCAGAVEGSRWDCENFLMLCPAHASKKFPSERSKSRKNLAADTSRTTEMCDDGQSNVWTGSPVTSQWILCGSALSVEEKELMAKFARICGATVSKFWRPEVTHVIASTNELGACTRTLKVLMAILNGKWILNINWIKASMEEMTPLSEEPYEVNLDIHGCKDGPINGRLRVINKAPKLFSGINFYFSGEFIASYKGYLEDLVVAAGGRLLTKDVLLSQAPIQGTENLILYSLDHSQTSKREEVYSVIERSRGEAEALGAQTGSWVTDHTWLLESIAACKLQPLLSA